MRKRLNKLDDKSRKEVYDLFELSPLSVSAIAKIYLIRRETVYRIVKKIESGGYGYSFRS